MVKAKDFWHYLCNELEYRFFAGLPALRLKPLYNKMNSKFMHYIPAANEQIALWLANGAKLGGVKSGVIMPSKKLNYIDFDFNHEFKLPILILTDDKIKLTNKINSAELKEDFDESVGNLVKKIEKNNKLGVLFIGEGVLK